MFFNTALLWMITRARLNRYDKAWNLLRGNLLKLLLVLVNHYYIYCATCQTIAILSICINDNHFYIPFVNILLVVAYRKLIYSHQDVDDDLAETK